MFNSIVWFDKAEALFTSALGDESRIRLRLFFLCWDSVIIDFLLGPEGAELGFRLIKGN